MTDEATYLEAAREAREAIGIALDHYRDAVADALEAGCSVQEVADALNVSRNTIRQTLRARALTRAAALDPRLQP